MKVEDYIVHEFYSYFWGYLVGSSLLVVMLLIGVIFRKKFFANPTASKFIMLRTSIVFLFGCLFALFLCYKLSIYSLDYSNVKNREFLEITGEVIRYKRSVYQNDGTSGYFDPVILDNEGNEVFLIVLDTELGQTYTFKYLEHTHIAGIVDELDE